MANRKRKVGAGGEPPKKEPSDYRGWLKRALSIVSECQLSDCFDPVFTGPALVALDRAIALRPNDPVAWKEMGTLLLRMGAGREREARAALTRAVQLDPRNAYARVWLGVAESVLGDWEAAREHYKRAIALDPHIRGIYEYQYDIPDELREAFFADDPADWHRHTLAGRTRRGT